MLTINLINDIILGVEREADFLLSKIRTQSRLEKPNRFSLISRNASFLLEGTMSKRCKCGCGQEIIILQHHKNRGIPNFVHGHNPNGCKGKKKPELSGDKHPMYGKHHTEATIKKIKLARARQGSNVWNKGKTGLQPCSEETKEKLRKCTKEYNKKHPERMQIMRLKSSRMLGKHHSEAIKEKMSIYRKEWLKTHLNPLAGLPAWNKGKKHPQITGGKHHNWKGGKFKDKDGYVLIKSYGHPFANKDCYVREHRLVIEDCIGRYLLSNEKCHHFGRTDDNRPCMLMAFTSQSAHQRFHGNPNNVKPEEIIFDGRTYKKN